MPELQQRLMKIKALVVDSDGVLTDGAMLFPEMGQSMVRFHIHDGLGIVLARRAGLEVAVVSGRSRIALSRRAEELGMTEVLQGVHNKVQALRNLARKRRWDLSEVAYMGDDLNDLPAMEIAGAALAVADAVEEVKRAAHWVSSKKGGDGAVREALETILEAQGRWQDAVQAYLAHLRTL